MKSRFLSWVNVIKTPLKSTIKIRLKSHLKPTKIPLKLHEHLTRITWNPSRNHHKLPKNHHFFMAPPFRRGAGAQVQPELAQPQDFLLAAVVDVEDSWRGRWGGKSWDNPWGKWCFDHFWSFVWHFLNEKMEGFFWGLLAGGKNTFFARQMSKMNDFSWLE